MGHRVGIDIGGTFTDLVLLRDDGEFHIYKGVTHAFTHSSSWGSYDGTATANAFKRALRFLDTHLKGKSG